MSEHKHVSGSDRVGIASAILCMIHCMVVPVAFGLKVWLSHHGGFDLPGWWGMLDYVFLIISFWAVYHSSSHAVSQGVKIAFWSFWGVLTVAILLEEYIHWVAYIASFGLIATHIVNLRMQRMLRVAGA